MLENVQGEWVRWERRDVTNCKVEGVRWGET